MNELISIQSALKAKKGQFNKFGGYAYRSCEDILEALKPLLNKNNCYLTITDDIINIGNHNYIKSTATIFNDAGSVSATGIAREAEVQKGMADAQITGSTSSYARKYALNGLFAIDDAKDDDTKAPEQPEETKAELIKKINSMYRAVKDPNKELQEWIKKINTLNIQQLKAGIKGLHKKIQEQK